MGWLWRQPLDRICGGRNESERRGALRQYTEEPVRQGGIQRPWDRLVGGLVLGTEAFARGLLRQVRADTREQPAVRKLGPRLIWAGIVAAVEKVKGEDWAEFSGRHGDWGRDAALWLGRKRGRYKLSELGQLAGGMDYAAVGQAVSRFDKRVSQGGDLKRNLVKVERQMSNVEM